MHQGNDLLNFARCSGARKRRLARPIPREQPSRPLRDSLCRAHSGHGRPGAPTRCRPGTLTSASSSASLTSVPSSVVDAPVAAEPLLAPSISSSVCHASLGAFNARRHVSDVVQNVGVFQLVIRFSSVSSPRIVYKEFGRAQWPLLECGQSSGRS